MNELFNSQIITAMLDRIASIPDSSDIDQVMNYIVDIIRDEGNFYYVSLFLVDTAREWAVFRSGNEEYREQFLSKGFKFRLGSSSIVGQAVVEDDLQIFDYDREGCIMSPLLPDTRWELALPLNAGGDVIGVLKIEGTDIDSFDYEEAKPIQRVADSVADKLADTIATDLRLGDNDLGENNIPILIAVPDDLGKIVSIYLQQKKLLVKTIYSYSDALKFLLSNPVRGIITVSEWAVPDEEGVFRGLFEESEKKIPIIVLVRRENFHYFFTQYHNLFNSPYDPSLARDDYVTIPFDPDELFHCMQIVGIVDDSNVTQEN